MDFVETPSIATIELLKREKFVGNILEPACGKGAISKVLIDKGYEVISKDKIDRGYGEKKNFFEENEIYSNIITNPPFKFATEFAFHAINHVKNKVAFLLRTNFLETEIRRYFLFDNPKLPTYFSKLYVFSNRLPFGDSNMVVYCWYIWDKSFSGNPTIHWI